MAGWIKLYRDITNHWLYESKPFDKRSAWIDLLLQANYEDKDVPLGNEIIEVKRGSFITSIRKLADRWGWSRTKVEAFLHLLELQKKKKKKSDNNKTTIFIVNYANFQDVETTEKPVKSHRKATEKPQKSLTKNIKNKRNKENINNKGDSLSENEGIYRKIQPLELTVKEFNKLNADYSEQDIDDVLDNMENYKKLKNYKSAYLTAKNWLKKRAAEGKASEQPKKKGGARFGHTV